MMKAISLLVMFMAVLSINAQDYSLNGNLTVGVDSTNTLDVTGDSHIQGNTDIDGELKLAGLAAPSTEYPAIMYTDENGRVLSMTGDEVEDFLVSLYQIDCKGETGTYVPVWQNSPGMLYVYDPCVPSPRVGIDTDSPNAALHVVGSQILCNDESANLTAFNSQQLLLYKEGGSSAQYGLRVACEENFKPLAVSDKTTGEDKFRVMGNGNLYSTKIIVEDYVNFPDYVFEDDYVLMPLDELEKFIQENKHLPNMPSSSDVAAKGGDLGELVRLLTEKVEELTLHTIEQQKRIDELEKRSVDAQSKN